MAHTLTNSELESLTRKRYGSADAIRDWSDRLDDLISELESLRDDRREIIRREHSEKITMAAARRATHLSTEGTKNNVR